MRRMSVYRRFQKVCVDLICSLVFPSGWNFKLRTKEFPNYPSTISTPNSYMLIPHSARNIAHYMEVYNIVYHILHQPHRFPKVYMCIVVHRRLIQYSIQQWRINRSISGSKSIRKLVCLSFLQVISLIMFFEKS